jgi:hypothetical protein
VDELPEGDRTEPIFGMFILAADAIGNDVAVVADEEAGAGEQRAVDDRIILGVSGQGRSLSSTERRRSDGTDCFELAAKFRRVRGPD